MEYEGAAPQVNGHLLDTHVWFWLLGATETSLKRKHRDLLEDASQRGELFLSAISIWEAAQKSRSTRAAIRVSIEDMMEESFADGSIVMLDVTPVVLIASQRLPGDIQGDPADRILAATARIHSLSLVTHDRALRDYARQGHLAVHAV